VGIGEAGFVSGGMALIVGMCARPAGLLSRASGPRPSAGISLGFLVGGWVTKSWAGRRLYGYSLAGHPLRYFGMFMPDYKVDKAALEKAGGGRSNALAATLREMVQIKTLPILYIAIALAICLQQGAIPWVRCCSTEVWE